LHDSCDGKRELLQVLRRLTAMLFVWVGLLGPASAAFACATLALKADCCPADSSGPCSDQTTGAQPALPATCCVAAPTRSKELTLESRRSDRELDRNSDPPELAINAGWAAPSRPVALAGAAPLAATDARSDGTLTFLLTGRLRL
jgi:hypothetical protein